MKSKIILALFLILVTASFSQSQNNDIIFEEKEKKSPEPEQSLETEHIVGIRNALRRNVDNNDRWYNLGIFYDFGFKHGKEFLSLRRLGTGLSFEYHTTSESDFVLSAPLSYSLDFGRLFFSYGILSYVEKEKFEDGNIDKTRKVKDLMRIGLIFDYNINRYYFGIFLFQDFIDDNSFVNYGINFGYEI